jgi:hypothetical protein
MRAAEIDEEFPAVDIDSPALDAARMLAEHRLPGIVVSTADGQLYAVLPASQVVRFIMPRYVQDDPLLAHVLRSRWPTERRRRWAARRFASCCHNAS